MDRSSKLPLLLAVAAGVAAGLAGGWFAFRTPDPHAGHETAAAPAAAPASAAERKVLYWYDPMVPGQKFDKPGKSPFMDMQLVAKYADEEEADAAATVKVSAQAQQSLGLRTATAEKRTLAASVDAVGSVQLNEREVSIVQSRANGYVERVYALAPGDVVAAGAPIADLMHPEWLAAQQEYLAVRATGDAALTAASRQRMVLLGMPAPVVEKVEQGGKPIATTTVSAPAGGLVAELMVRNGMTVSAGMTLAKINGLGTVWVEAAVPEALAAAVAPGQPAEVRLAAADKPIRGRVAAVLPEANRESRTLRVRVELPNPGQRLRPGMFAQVALRGAAKNEAVVVPVEAVIRTGRRSLVYLVEDGGRYRPLEVELGQEVEGRVVIKSGLEAGQKVVASGQFLIDSEASLLGITPKAKP